MIKMNHTSTCTTSNTRHDKNPVISHERGKDFTLTKEHIQYTIVYSFLFERIISNLSYLSVEDNIEI